MKAIGTIVKILTALAAVAGAVYVLATYGDKIVAWAKKLMGCACECCCCDDDCCCEEDCCCDDECCCEEACCCEAAEEAPAEEACCCCEAAAEAPAEEAPAEEAVAEPADFAE